MAARGCGRFELLSHQWSVIVLKAVDIEEVLGIHEDTGSKACWDNSRWVLTRMVLV